MERMLVDLFERLWGVKPDRVEALPLSGSARRYYRLYRGERSCIGVYNRSLEENRLFIGFTEHFAGKHLLVPRILAVGEEGMTYLQEDLGRSMLLDVVVERRKKTAAKRLDTVCVHFYCKALSELLRFQFIGGEGLDYSQCVPRPLFDRRCMAWDLNYFKYCFLRLTGASFAEDALENDFDALLNRLETVPAETFMFRDFQSRNIMVRGDDVWFIDYQGGRKGALHYDVASLLYDAIVAIPEEQREELLDYYIRNLQAFRPTAPEVFRADYYHFVLLRLLQALGAFGLRGLHERKQHFIDSIAPGVKNVCTLFESGKLGNDYPELYRAIKNTALKEG